MKTIAPFSKIARLGEYHRPLLAEAGSWIERAHRWLAARMLQSQAESLARLNDHLLRDIGIERPPSSRIEEWWRIPPPL
ncbi:DUF1127 domain-containing protein [Microvirga rosea]|uniref:DUF1127 domain-containing protein n=1 Tax=Microvirga rosea TaxID=2715425 RepID=UPI001D09D942|nr:DUF1127 domain-containing protein [Microvirga rosea]MCB8821263.1 DUF1127 domain-containing protein [Microvirga rosea]